MFSFTKTKACKRVSNSNTLMTLSWLNGFNSYTFRLKKHILKQRRVRGSRSRKAGLISKGMRIKSQRWERALWLLVWLMRLNMLYKIKTLFCTWSNKNILWFKSRLWGVSKRLKAKKSLLTNTFKVITEN